MLKIVNMPITTSDQQANESIQGLCPMLCGDVGSISLASSAMVASEYGVRKAIDDLIVSYRRDKKIDDIFGKEDI